MNQDVIHHGGCHCGAVRYELQNPAELEVHDCNCSICSKVGYLHITVPKDKLKILTGADRLTSYQFNTGVANHMFCSICGVKAFYVPRSHPDGYSVNARTLDPGTVKRMTIIPFEGADWENHIAELPPLA
jgi:hypothetical protein